MSTEKKEQDSIVGFRLDPRRMNKLSMQANRSGITSPHLQARKIVEAALDGWDEEARLMRVEVAKLRAEVEAIRAGLVAILGVLVERSSNGKESPEEVISSVKQAFAKKIVR